MLISLSSAISVFLVIFDDIWIHLNLFLYKYLETPHAIVIFFPTSITSGPLTWNPSGPTSKNLIISWFLLVYLLIFCINLSIIKKKISKNKTLITNQFITQVVITNHGRKYLTLIDKKTIEFSFLLICFRK